MAESPDRRGRYLGYFQTHCSQHTGNPEGTEGLCLHLRGVGQGTMTPLLMRTVHVALQSHTCHGAAGRWSAGILSRTFRIGGLRHTRKQCWKRSVCWKMRAWDRKKRGAGVGGDGLPVLQGRGRKERRSLRQRMRRGLSHRALRQTERPPAFSKHYRALAGAGPWETGGRGWEVREPLVW